MNTLIHHSQASTILFRAGGGSILFCCMISLLGGHAYGDTLAACAESVPTTAQVTLNGVVAGGVATQSCKQDGVWPDVVPRQLFPSKLTMGSAQSKGNLYLAYRESTKKLYIGIDVAGDKDLSDQDVVVVVFDATNNGTFEPGDFYVKVRASGSVIPKSPNGGEECDQPPGRPDQLEREYYNFIGGEKVWLKEGNPEVASNIKAKVSYDYGTKEDSDIDIWNLEIEMPVKLSVMGTTYFDLRTTPGAFDPRTTLGEPGYFGVGAYVFVDDGRQNPKKGGVLKWPDTLPDRSVANQFLGFSPPVVEASKLADVKLDDVCFDVNFNVDNAFEINGPSGRDGSYSIKRDSPNSFKINFYFDGPGDKPETLPTNRGKLNLSLTPMRASGPGSAWTQSKDKNANTFNQAHSVQLDFDFEKPDQGFGNVTDVDHVCAKACLMNFERDDDSLYNCIEENFNFLVTSQYRQDFFLLGDGLPNLKPGERTTIFLHMEMTNEVPEPSRAGVGGLIDRLTRRRWREDFWPALGLSLFSISLIVIRLSRKSRGVMAVRNYAAAVAAVGLIVLLWSGCTRIFGPKIGTDRWQVKNVRELGIRPIKGLPDWYEMPIKYGERKRVELEFSGKRLPYETAKHELEPAGPDGKPTILRIPVKPGRVMTVLASGQIDLDGPEGPLEPTSPTGFVRSQPDQTTRRYLLSEGYYSPNEFEGALIGSFNDFETSFVVSRNSSIIVPDDAGTLALAVNAVDGSYAAITGSFDVFIIDTDGPRVPTHTVIQGNAFFRVPNTRPVWDTLTTLHVYSYYQTLEFVEGATIPSQPLLHPWGAAHFSIYDTRE